MPKITGPNCLIESRLDANQGADRFGPVIFEQPFPKQIEEGLPVNRS